MSEFLLRLTEFSATIIDIVAVAVILYGTLEAFVAVIAHIFPDNDDGERRRKIWLRFARWLVAGLTFQLAADILETSITPDWDSLGRLAAIAVIRTFLNYFLERDVEEIRARQSEPRTQGGRNARRA